MVRARAQTQRWFSDHNDFQQDHAAQCIRRHYGMRGPPARATCSPLAYQRVYAFSVTPRVKTMNLLSSVETAWTGTVVVSFRSIA
jgi:hypothetical protein